MDTSPILIKTKSKSFFEVFHRTSARANELFNSEPMYKKERVTVLQLAAISENYFMTELLLDKDIELVP